MKKSVIVVLLVALILVLAPSTLMAKISGDPLMKLLSFLPPADREQAPKCFVF